MMESYGCQTFSFDPANTLVDPDRSAFLHFVKVGLAARNVDKDPVTHWKLQTLASIYDMLEPRHGVMPIDYLKISIDSAEWDVVPQIIDSGMLYELSISQKGERYTDTIVDMFSDGVKQLGIQFHMNSTGTIEQHRRYAKIIKSIEDFGMTRFSSKPHPLSYERIATLSKDDYSVYDLHWIMIAY